MLKVGDYVKSNTRVRPKIGKVLQIDDWWVRVVLLFGKQTYHANYHIEDLTIVPPEEVTLEMVVYL